MPAHRFEPVSDLFGVPRTVAAFRRGETVTFSSFAFDEPE
jgi:hypothetical protein